MVIVGIDPDTKKHGVAWLKDGVFLNVCSLATAELVTQLCADAAAGPLVIKLEDINFHRPVFPRAGMTRYQMLKIAQNVGAAKNAANQLHVELVKAGLAVNMIIPLSKIKSGKRFKDSEQFNRFTGWTGKSNADSRDAAMIALNGNPAGRHSLLVCGG